MYHAGSYPGALVDMETTAYSGPPGNNTQGQDSTFSDDLSTRACKQSWQEWSKLDRVCGGTCRSSTSCYTIGTENPGRSNVSDGAGSSSSSSGSGERVAGGVTPQLLCCGHTLHFSCLDSYLKSEREQHRRLQHSVYATSQIAGNKSQK